MGTPSFACAKVAHIINYIEMSRYRNSKAPLQGLQWKGPTGSSVFILCCFVSSYFMYFERKKSLPNTREGVRDKLLQDSVMI
jgi:hypothetical protein